MTTKCPACSSPFKTIYYQRRAADEPPDAVSYCEYCPVDTKKLSIKDISGKTNDSVSIQNNNSLTLPTKRQQSYSTVRNKHSTSFLALVVRGAAAQRCLSITEEENSTLTSIICTMILINSHNRKNICKFYINSEFANSTFLVTESFDIAPYVTLQSGIQYYQDVSSTHKSNRFVDCYAYSIAQVTNSKKAILFIKKDKKDPYIFILVDIQNSNIKQIQIHVLNILHQVLLLYGTENTIKSFISSKLISTLYVQSARAYDSPSAPTSGYVFTWKPDGERYWCIRYGSLWLFCRRLLSGKILGWTLATNIITDHKLGPILDVEVMIGHSPILIDVLVLQDGTPTSQLRTLSEVLKIYRDVKRTGIVDIPIHVRAYFGNEKQVLATKDSLTYPVDGTIGIEIDSVTIIKLKPVKSIELKLLSDGSLVSAEGNLVLTSNIQDIYSPESIIEIRFSVSSNNEEPTIHEYILRTDKVKANEYSVCQEIMKLTLSTPEILSRRKALLWCNSIRHEIHNIAARQQGKGRIIIDIGAGDGQAISDYTDNPNITYILVEPNKAKCKQLLKRLSSKGKDKCVYYDDPGYILKALASGSKGTIKYSVFNCTIQDIVSQPNCVKTMLSTVRCCTASFSISYIASVLQHLVLEGIDVIGCGYLYNSTDNTNYLINKHGVVMKRISSTTATVKWGNDKIYTEYPITEVDFKEFNIDKASKYIPIDAKDDNSLLADISNAVYIISTI